ncbi:MAG: hypothetical protein E6R08_00375 [Nevskiaceae bacterium]|nr:MAG: hypothetical protein E6R08_00375 [Nevskiaceae bacterium]
MAALLDWGNPNVRKTAALAGMIFLLASAAYLQMRANRAPADDDEVAAVKAEGPCERQLLSKWESAPDSKELTKLDLQQVQATCARQAEMDGRAADVSSR